MSHGNILGVWYCKTVDYDQSSERAGKYGEYEGEGMPSQRASRTDFATNVLEFKEDGSYALTGGKDYSNSFGTWTLDKDEDGDDDLTLEQSRDCTNGFEFLESSSLYEGEVHIWFKLGSDSHDGQDLLVLSFGRTAPKRRSRSRSRSQKDSGAVA